MKCGEHLRRSRNGKMLENRCLGSVGEISGTGNLISMQRKYMGVSKNSGTPKSSILLGFSIINHPFWDTPILGNIHIYIYRRQPGFTTIKWFVTPVKTNEYPLKMDGSIVGRWHCRKNWPFFRCFCSWNYPGLMINLPFKRWKHVQQEQNELRTCLWHLMGSVLFHEWFDVFISRFSWQLFLCLLIFAVYKYIYLFFICTHTHIYIYMLKHF